MSDPPLQLEERLLTPGEVAAKFRVDPKTVSRWAAGGRIGSIRTPGGHRRFRESEVRALLEGKPAVTTPAPAPSTTAIDPGYSPQVMAQNNRGGR